MRILSMTATFGKLDHQTLTLQPGLNVIHAPNEWGKSTWCAFLVAMLYGIETRAHSTKAILADKERYAPWSGAPMSGRMDILWKERAITLERRSKGRGIFNDFRAYETETGLAIPELTAATCGQVLLGVEKSVFLRAGFLRLTDLPVTQDESLRRRLNALVTTGDESGTSDRLAQKLRDLKNRCRFNRSGLLPQAEAQRDQLENKLSQLHTLQEQIQRLKIRQTEVDARIHALENHRDALKYAANRSYAQKLNNAKNNADATAETVRRLQADCADLPSRETAERKLKHLHQLRETWEALHMEYQMLPQPPAPPETASCFRGKTPEEAVNQAQDDQKTYEALLQGRKRFPPVLLFIAIALLLAGAGLLYAAFPIYAAVSAALGIAVGIVHFVLKASVSKNNQLLDERAIALLSAYAPLPPEQWREAADAYTKTMYDHQTAMQVWQEGRGDLDTRIADLKEQLTQLSEDGSVQTYQQKWTDILERQRALEEALREQHRAEELLQAMISSHREVPAPKEPDSLTFNEAETASLLSDAAAEQRQLQLRLGQYLGQMENLGQESALRQQLLDVNSRISHLEDTYAALTLAQQTLAEAANELQRRFAPRIAQRAQTLFSQLTDNRYNRLSLGADLSVSAGAEQEDTLRPSLWRSDGTVDQLYLALRLAVAEELTPEAPLILDDALVRFDDQRLATALQILSEEANARQVLLFTCQTRELQLMSTTNATDS